MVSQYRQGLTCMTEADVLGWTLSIYNPVISKQMRDDETGTRSGQKPMEKVRNRREYI